MVWTFDEAWQALRTTVFDVVHLDHDLNDFHVQSVEPGMYGGRKLTGLDVVLCLVELPEHRRPKHVIVHSWNIEGGARMVEELQKAGISVERKEFGEYSITLAESYGLWLPEKKP